MDPPPHPISPPHVSLVTLEIDVSQLSPKHLNYYMKSWILEDLLKPTNRTNCWFEEWNLSSSFYLGFRCDSPMFLQNITYFSPFPANHLEKPTPQKAAQDTQRSIKATF